MDREIKYIEDEKELKEEGRFLVDNFGVDMGNISYILLGPLIFLIIFLLPIPGLDWQAAVQWGQPGRDGVLQEDYHLKYFLILVIVPANRSGPGF